MEDSQTKNPILERMREVLGVSSDYALAQEMGKSTSSLHNWKKKGSLPLEECSSFCMRHGISLDWLVHGVGTRELNISDSGSNAVKGYSQIPIYDIEAAAGDGRLFDAELIETSIHFDTEQLQRDGLDPSQLVGIRVRGDSMGETLQDGDRVLVDRSSRTPDGVFLLRMDGGLRIKRVQRVAGGAWMLISDNTHYQPEMIKPEEMGQVEIIGECRVRIGRIN